MKRYGIATGLPDVAPMQDESQFRLMNPIYQALNGLAKTVSDVTGVTSYESTDIQQSGPFIEYQGNLGFRMNFEAAENIEPGRLIHLYNGGAGEVKMLHADANSALQRRAYGVCVDTATVVTGKRGRVVLFDMLLSGISGVTPGAVYWLGVTGGFSAVQPTAAGWLQQPVGIGLTSGSIRMRINM